MDPNKTLDEFCQAWVLANTAAEGDSNDAEIEALWEVAETAFRLIEWLAVGGFQPDWERMPKALGELR